MKKSKAPLILFIVLIIFSMAAVVHYRLEDYKRDISYTLRQDMIQSSYTESNNEDPVNKSQPIWLSSGISYWDEEYSYRRLNEVVEHLDALSPIFYRIMPDGSLGSQEAKFEQQVLSLARDNKLILTPLIGDDFDYTRIRKLLYNPAVQGSFIDDLVEEGTEQNFTGWDIDIETLEADDRSAFTQFVRSAARELHNSNLSLTMTLFAKDEREIYEPAMAQNYAEIAKHADKLQLMVYNYSNTGTEPGGQAPSNWYRSVLRYATQTIPRDKIIVALSTHGLDWGQSDVIELTYQDAAARVNKYGIDVGYDAEQLSAFGSYSAGGEEREIWYEDAQAIAHKIRIAREEFGIHRFALWRVGAEDPELWQLLFGPASR